MIASKNPKVIDLIIKAFAQQNENLVKYLLRLQYYFRGSLSRDDVWAMSYAEREIATEFLNDRFKEAGDFMKKQIPVFI